MRLNLGGLIGDISKLFTPQPKPNGNVMEGHFNKTLTISGIPRISHTVDPFAGVSLTERVTLLKKEQHTVN